MARRLPAVALLSALLLGAGAAGTAGAPGPVSSARAVAIQVLVPGQSDVLAGAVSAPPQAASSGAFAYPADGSVVSAVSFAAKATAASAKTGSSAGASAEVASLSIFGGEVTVGSVVAVASASATPAGGSGDYPGAAVTGLVVLGEAIAAGPAAHVALGDWGYADALSQSTAPGSASGAPSYQEQMTALSIRLTADHGGLPAGSAILIGYAEAAAQGVNPVPPPPPPPPPTTTTAPVPLPAPQPAPQPAPKPKPAPPQTTKSGAKTKPTTKPKPTTKTKPKTKPQPQPTKPKPKRKKTPLAPPEAPEAKNGLPVVHAPPLTETPKLTAGRYVFPVYGPSSYTDTFGAPRADVVWHHGDDIFAPLGAPVLACVDGTVFAVGWNHLGGYRLWLRDRKGNQFYYAHLSAYSPLAVNGRKVRAGAVLGFVGNTGDAVGTSYHLHFEVHPVSLLHLGYDGAVNPTQYLDAWKRLVDVRFTPEGWAALPGKAKKGVKPAPPPGAILLQATDISTASGLDPASFERVLAPVSAEGDGVLVGFTQAPPAGPRPVRPIRAR